MQAATITASATIVVAVLAFLFNQYSQTRLERRQGYLARVNSQLRDLYGPLFALVDVNEWVWESLRASGLPPVAERSPETLRRDWANWRDAFLMPTNVRMRDLIMQHADLLTEADFPAVLRDFCAHVGSCEVLAESGVGATTGGRAAPFPVPVHISHPGSEFVDYVRRSYAQLNTEQQRLLSPRLRTGTAARSLASGTRQPNTAKPDARLHAYRASCAVRRSGQIWEEELDLSLRGVAVRRS